MALPADLSHLSREELIRLIEELLRQLEDLKRQNEELRRQKRSAAPFSKGKRNCHRARPGRKKGQGVFRRREPPQEEAPAVEVAVGETVCPVCGGQLEPDGAETVSTTDMAERPEPETRVYRVHIGRCQKCRRRLRGKHPEVAAGQHGATAHRVGPRVKALAHAMHYGHGVPVRRVPRILEEMTGIELTQSALTQDALNRAEGAVGDRYRQLRSQVRQAAVTYTDDTGWRVGGEAAYLMAFDTDRGTVYQIRSHHGHEQVLEIIPADYGGVLVTDRGPSYEAEVLSRVKQSKCLAHLLRNVEEVLDKKRGGARQFGIQLKDILQGANQLWNHYRAGKIDAAQWARQGAERQAELKKHLRHRRLRDPDNQRLLDTIGLQTDRGRILVFLDHPEVEPTNNRAERALRPAVIARKVSHCSKTQRGAEAFAAFHSVLQTGKKIGLSFVQTMAGILGVPQR